MSCAQTIRFPNHMNEGKPSFKSRSWNKKSKAKTQCVHNVNGKRFYYKYDKNRTRS
jgi:hypothetical protein